MEFITDKMKELYNQIVIEKSVAWVDQGDGTVRTETTIKYIKEGDDSMSTIAYNGIKFAPNPIACSTTNISYQMPTHKTITYYCECCGQDYVINEEFKGFIPHCTNCGSIMKKKGEN